MCSSSEWKRKMERTIDEIPEGAGLSALFCPNITPLEGHSLQIHQTEFSFWNRSPCPEFSNNPTVRLKKQFRKHPSNSGPPTCNLFQSHVPNPRLVADQTRCQVIDKCLEVPVAPCPDNRLCTKRPKGWGNRRKPSVSAGPLYHAIPVPK